MKRCDIFPNILFQARQTHHLWTENIEECLERQISPNKLILFSSSNENSSARDICKGFRTDYINSVEN